MRIIRNDTKIEQHVICAECFEKKQDGKTQCDHCKRPTMSIHIPKYS